MEKKGATTIRDILPLGLMLTVAVIALSVGAQLVDDIQDGQITYVPACGTNSTGGSNGTILYTNCTYAYNASANGLEGLGEMGSWWPTIALVLAAAIVIGVLVTSFSMR